MSDQLFRGSTRREVKTCEFGHYWYIGGSCPMCEIVGRDNLEKALQERFA